MFWVSARRVFILAMSLLRMALTTRRLLQNLQHSFRRDVDPGCWSDLGATPDGGLTNLFWSGTKDFSGFTSADGCLIPLLPFWTVFCSVLTVYFFFKAFSPATEYFPFLGRASRGTTDAFFILRALFLGAYTFLGALAMFLGVAKTLAILSLWYL